MQSGVPNSSIWICLKVKRETTQLYSITVKENKISFKPLGNFAHPLWVFLYYCLRRLSQKEIFITLRNFQYRLEEWDEFYVQQCCKGPKSLGPGRMSQIRQMVQIHHLEMNFWNRCFTSQLLSLIFKSTHQSSKSMRQDLLGCPPHDSEIPWLHKWERNIALTGRNVT